VTPGEVVERKRVADMMVQIQVAQQDPVRVREAAARLALREAPAVSLKPDRYPCRRVDPPASILEVVPMDRGEATTVEEGYAVRWIRKRPFLYKRAISTKTTADGRPAFEDTFVGTLAEDVAREWQRTGDPSAPPPLAQAVAVPAGPQRPTAAAKVAEDDVGRDAPRPPPSRKPRRPSTAMRPRLLPPTLAAPPPLPDPATRLATAIWYTDAFHTADTERLREWNEAVTRVHALSSPARLHPAAG
jgi:hypothetical protein